MNTVIAPPPPTLLPVRGQSARFPVRRVYCVGQNYAAHTAEMGGDPKADPPLFFQKNPDDLDPSGAFPWPGPDTHHEIELALCLGGGGTDIAEAEARGLIWGYAVALDMTRRAMQAEDKAARRPWTLSKAFARSAPVSPVAPAQSVGHPRKGAITLSVNGHLRQRGELSDLIWSPEAIIAELSRFVTLAAGDVILTGTPSGVGPVARGDALEGFVEGVGSLSVAVV